MTSEQEASIRKRLKDELRERNREVAPKVYGPMIEPLRFIARTNGYALAVHGSQLRDLDLVAIPWVDWAVGPTELATAIHKGMPELNKFDFPAFERKPHGRIAFEFSFFCDLIDSIFSIDLSITPRLSYSNQSCPSCGYGRGLSCEACGYIPREKTN